MTSHCLRRGGATWHFKLYSSFDRTASHGRWSQVKTCRLYIDEAMSDLASTKQGLTGKARVATAVAAFPAAVVQM